MNYEQISVEVSRGGLIESKHGIKAAVVSSSGKLIDSWGDIELPVYPRSAIKAMQALPLIESGGHENYGFTSAEIAICCASHNGEQKHVETVQNMLNKIQLEESDFECGCHWPMRAETSYQLASEGKEPNQLHNNCSGKHAGMLTLSKVLKAPHQGYIGIEHPVQERIARVMAEMCEVNYADADWSPDGCSAPTWAIPLYNLALAFAKFADPSMLESNRRQACKTIYQSVIDNPYMVAGTERYCTDVMKIFGDKVFLKTGAEGVYVAAIPEMKLAIALKCQDGATRAAESAMTALLDHVGITGSIPADQLQAYRSVELQNWNKLTSGYITCKI